MRSVCVRASMLCCGREVRARSPKARKAAETLLSAPPRASRAIAPTIQAFSEQYTDAVFIKVRAVPPSGALISLLSGTHR